MAKNISLTTFASRFADFKIGTRKDSEGNTFVSAYFVSEDGDKTYVSAPKSGNALSLVDFSTKESAMRDIRANADKLTILIGWSDVSDKETYTLVDTLESDDESVKFW